jgi:hypothetical protein
VALVVAGALLSPWSGPEPADAAVTPAQGFRATVLGWSSWYGSYRMGALGEAWCIDHGRRAPDPALAYVPTAASDVDADTAAAISWIVTAHVGAGPVDAAAVMLAVHDLRHATYPFGVLDVGALRPSQLAGFGGHEAEVISRARQIRAEGWAHRDLRVPLHVTVNLAAGSDAETGSSRTAALDVDGRATVTVTDRDGRPVVGAGVALDAVGAAIDGLAAGATSAAGTFVRGYRVDAGPVGARATVTAHVIVPSPVPATYASSTTSAQRVVRGSWLGLQAQATTTPPSTTTSSTSTTSTTTAPTSTTSTTSTSTSTTSTSTTSTTSTSMPVTSTTTTAPPSATTAPPTPVRPTIPPGTDTPGRSTPFATAPAPTTATGGPTATTGTLPRTGARTGGWILIGAGLVLLGSTLVAVSRGWLR